MSGLTGMDGEPGRPGAWHDIPLEGEPAGVGGVGSYALTIWLKKGLSFLETGCRWASSQSAAAAMVAKLRLLPAMTDAILTCAPEGQGGWASRDGHVLMPAILLVREKVKVGLIFESKY